MKVTMFLSPSESFEGKYFGEIAWAYYFLENEELLSTTMDTRQEVIETISSLFLLISLYWYSGIFCRFFSRRGK